MNLPQRTSFVLPPSSKHASVPSSGQDVLMAAVEGAGKIRWMVLARAAVRGIGGEPVFIVDSEHETVDGARAAVKLARLQRGVASQCSSRRA